MSYKNILLAFEKHCTHSLPPDLKPTVTIADHQVSFFTTHHNCFTETWVEDNEQAIEEACERLVTKLMMYGAYRRPEPPTSLVDRNGNKIDPRKLQ